MINKNQIHLVIKNKKEYPQDKKIKNLIIKMENIYDVAIIGLGPAGYSAAIYCNRYKLKTILIGEKIGGTMTEAWEVGNFPSYEKISGIELTKKMHEQIKTTGLEVKTEIVSEIEKKGNNFTIKTENSKYHSKSVILCLGKEKAKLYLKNEEKFIGKGISYCVTCDAPL